MRSLSILDSTLREGEQYSGAFFTFEQRLMIAHLLDALGVTFIEVPSPISSPGAQHTVHALCESGLLFVSECLNLPIPFNMPITAPGALQACGIRVVIARSFARIFYRNAVNIGLPVLVCEEAVLASADGQQVEVDLATGTIRNITTDQMFQAEPLNP